MNKIERKINLYVNYYKDNVIERNDEIEYCLKHNFDNNLIDQIFIISDCKRDGLFLSSLPLKAHFIKIDKNNNLNKIFEIINKNSNADDISILANLDITFDDTLNIVKDMFDTDACIALTRYDVGENEIKFHDRVDSQDAWIFYGKIKNINKMYLSFSLGVRGCDNRLAYELSRQYKIFNPSLTIKTYHHHLSGIRNYTQESSAVPKPYLTLKPVEWSVFATSTNTYIKDEPNKDETELVYDNKKVLLHISLNNEGQTMLQSALKTICNKYINYEWKKDYKNVNNVKTKILNLVYKEKPDLIFMQIQTPGIIESELINIINMSVPNCIIINWTGDVRMPIPQWYKDIGKCKNVITCFTNMDNVNEFKAMGLKSEYLQIGYEHNIFTPNGTIKKVPEIVFMGNNYSNINYPLSKLRSEMVVMLNYKFGNRFQVYGNGWNNELNPIDFMKKPYEEAAVYRSCKIAISLSHFDLSRYSSDRMFRIMGSGAFCLSYEYKDIGLDFKENTHIGVWRSVDNLIDSINLYLNNDAKRNEIAKNGNKLVESSHRWINRINDLIKIIRW